MVKCIVGVEGWEIGVRIDFVDCVVEVVVVVDGVDVRNVVVWMCYYFGVCFSKIEIGNVVFIVGLLFYMVKGVINVCDMCV